MRLPPVNQPNRCLCGLPYATTHIYRARYLSFHAKDIID